MKKQFFKISQISQENTGFQPCIFIKKDSNTSDFLQNLQNF